MRKQAAGPVWAGGSSAWQHRCSSESEAAGGGDLWGAAPTAFSNSRQARGGPVKAAGAGVDRIVGSYSGFGHTRVVRGSESWTALAKGLQEAL